MQPSEYRKLKPGDVREVVERLEGRYEREREADLKMQADTTKAIMKGLGSVVRAIGALRQDLAKRPTL